MTRSGTVDTSAEAVAAHEITPNVPKGAKAIDPPPAIGPRDALVDPREGDIIPDQHEKGYHAGLVRQPAEAVSVDGVTVAGFHSIADEPSKFTGLGLKALKAAHRDEADLGVLAGPDPRPAFAMVPGVGMVDTSALIGRGPAPEAPAGDSTLGSQVEAADRSIASRDMTKAAGETKGSGQG